MRFRSKNALAGVLFVLLSLEVSAATTNGQKIYLEGVLAYNSGDYARAADRIAAALKEDPNEGLRKFKGPSGGLSPEDYLPHYYLGLSLEKIGKKGEALAELRESDRQGAVKAKASSYVILQAAMRRLEPPKPTAAPPTPTPLPARPTAAPTPAPQATRAPEGGRATPEPLARPTRTPRPTPASPSSSPVAPPPGASSATDTVQAAVLEGIRSFYKGDYPAAQASFQAYADASPTARLYLAYALVARDLLAEKHSEATLTKARHEYEEAKRLGAATEDRFVSPAVRAVLEAPAPK